ncbi:MAG: 1-phosphofructokinase [Oscillospiraceae bacterium]|jgi:1-phosphofructokinase
MIYTLTLNPSLDYVMKLDELKTGRVNRSTGEKFLPGGKGINVSIVLNNLGIDSVAYGLVGGFIGDEIERLASLKCRTDFIKMENGISRINLTVSAGSETMINATGPEATRNDIEKVFKKFEVLENGDYLVLSGSAPRGINDKIYELIIEKFMNRNINVIVDSEKTFLLNTIKHKPFLIKPNNFEMSEIFGSPVTNTREAVFCAKKFREAGVQNVLVSMGEKGAVLLCSDGNTYASPAPKGKLVSSVGAGDSMIAGFLAGYLEKGDYQYAFKTGIAAGSASAFSEELAEKEEVYRLMGELEYV